MIWWLFHILIQEFITSDIFPYFGVQDFLETFRRSFQLPESGQPKKRSIIGS